MSSLTLEHTFDSGSTNTFMFCFNMVKYKLYTDRELISGPDAIFTKRGTLFIQSLKGGAAYLTPVGPLLANEKDKLKVLRNIDLPGSFKYFY